MIVRKLIDRPIAVTMCLIALVVVGAFSLKYIPVSLMPDIDIPQITVQASYPGASVREIDEKVVAPLRNQLMQVAGLSDIRSESRMDAGSILMHFEPGSDIDLLFIEVNEKIDRIMSSLPKDLERPKVIKASAMDIPAFYLNLSLKGEKRNADGRLPAAGLSFAQLGKFARNVVCKRIEQLPQTAMVDMSGTVGTEIECIPDYTKLAAMGMSTADLEKAIEENNITLEALSVVDGLYRYNIHFDSQILSRQDIEDIYLNHNGRLLQFKDVCRVIEQPALGNGLVRFEDANAVTMAVIKQNDAQMEDLQTSMQGLLKDLRKEYPNIRFELTRDQTQLLTYSIDNLESNLLVGAVLACLVLFLFMRSWRLPLLIIITIPFSLILTLLCFHLLHISLNIISISGLILGVGMIVDNSIIVIDNIIQKRTGGLPLNEAIVSGTNEVFTPMLSSVLTTCSVFIPLIFLSGIAGALFYDQAMGVSLALFASLLVAVLVIPVYFKILFRKKDVKFIALQSQHHSRTDYYKLYHLVMKWVLRHAWICIIVFFGMIPLMWVFYQMIEKERLPYLPHEDALVTIDWNTGISAQENDERIGRLLHQVQSKLETSTAMIGAQDFILSHTKDITSSEAVLYIKAKSEDDLQKAQQEIEEFRARFYPKASIEFSTSGNLYDLIFSTNEADLEIHLQDQDGNRLTVSAARNFIDSLSANFPHISIDPVITETNLQYWADTEKMAVYRVSYQQLYSRLKETVNKNQIYRINDGAESVPVFVGVSGKQSEQILQNTVKSEQNIDIPLSYLIQERRGEDFKRLYAGSGGDFYPIRIQASDHEVEEIVDFCNAFLKRHTEITATYAGDYYSSRTLIMELAMVLTVALLLLYFILAAQFESVVQPLLILSEIVFDVLFVFLGLYLLGESINLMSMIGLVVMSGIIINDSILKVDTINRLRRGGMPLIKAIMVGGHQRLKPIVMTSLTTILAILPFLQRNDMGSALQYPLSVTLIIGMVVGTLVSLFFVPLMYFLVYRGREKKLKG